MTDLELIFDEVSQELEKARTKFPDQDIFVTLAALTEEIGELNQAVLRYHFEPKENVSLYDIRKEAVQSVVMVLRTLLDCGLYPIPPERNRV